MDLLAYTVKYFKENPEKWLHKDTDWIFTGWNLNDIEGFDKRE